MAWSYSSLTTFEKCPKKYYHLKIARDVQDKGGIAADYGTDVHEAAELNVRDNKPIPQKFGYMSPIVDRFKALPGEKLAEQKLGIGVDETGFIPCDFDDPNAWWRGIADLIVTDGRFARCIDYKTGKSSRYADLRQLDMLAAAVFLHHPEIVVIDSALLFVVCNDLVPKRHFREKLDVYLGTFDRELRSLDVAHASGVWNPKPSGLCGYCPVESCPHWYQSRR